MMAANGCESSERSVTIGLESAEDTRRLGLSLGQVATSGLVIRLQGRLGAGKTTLVEGLAQGIATEEWTSSPTFALAAEYLGGRIPLYHLDLYRLGDQVARELDWLDEYLYGDGVCAVEWAELLGDLLPEDCLSVRLSDGDEFASASGLTIGRLAQVTAQGAVATAVWEEWWSKWQS